MIESNCKQCGKKIVRLGSKAGVFCSIACKAEWQRSQKPVDKGWLYQKYVLEGLGAYRIGRIVKRDPKRVYEWLVDYGIPIRKRDWNVDGSEPELYWDRNWLYQEYVVNQRSAADIASDFDCEESNILYFLGKHGIETRTVSEAREIKYWGLVGEQNGMYGKSGPDCPNWRGGITPERQAFYSSQEWSDAVRDVWKRDQAICQRCGVYANDHDGLFHIHHIVSFQCKELRAEIDNLVLLCDRCHWFVHSLENTEKEFLDEQSVLES